MPAMTILILKHPRDRSDTKQTKLEFTAMLAPGLQLCARDQVKLANRDQFFFTFHKLSKIIHSTSLWCLMWTSNMEITAKCKLKIINSANENLPI